MSLSPARTIADAVLLEGYLLYPYRASAIKNHFRWSFGVLAPQTWADATKQESGWLELQCLIVPRERVRLVGVLRCLHLQERSIEEQLGDQRFRPVEQLEVDDQLHLTWDEGKLQEVEIEQALSGHDLIEQRFAFDASDGHELILDRSGAPRGRVRRRRWPVHGNLRVGVEPTEASRDLWRLTVRVENTTPFAALDARRDEALRSSMLSTHLILRLEGGAFVSMLDPPAWAKEAARACTSRGTHPVLAGAAGQHDLLLASPIILYDHPRVAPESPGDLFDATEIDELLTLRTATLTAAEKRLARATDARAKAIIDRVDTMPPEVWDRLHGAMRDLYEAEMCPKRPRVGQSAFTVGQRVRLCPGKRRTDAQDALFAGCIATIAEIKHDIDGRELLAVTIDDDPGAELHQWYGRFHHYYTDEVEPLEPQR